MISVKLMILLLLPIYTFFNMNLLRTHMFNFITHDFVYQFCLIILCFYLTIKFMKSRIYDLMMLEDIFANNVRIEGSGVNEKVNF